MLKNLENELRLMRVSLSEKEDQLILVQKNLDLERDEKMALIEEKNKVEDDWLMEKDQWQLERKELKTQLKNSVIKSTNVQNSEEETKELNKAYLEVMDEKKSLENENAGLKQEIKRLQMIISSPQDFDHMRSSMYTNEEDFGYSSSRNTLEKHQKQMSSMASSQLSEGDFLSLQTSNSHTTKSSFERKLKSLFGFSNRGGKIVLCLLNWAMEDTNQTNFGHMVT